MLKLIKINFSLKKNFTFTYLFLALLDLFSVHGLSLVVVSGASFSGCGAQASHCSDLSCCRARSLGV